MSEKEHARFSPSSVHRRMACPGSLALEEQVPHSTSKYADEGTAAHELMEWAFRDNATFLDVYEGKRTKVGLKITKEMIDGVQTFVDTIRAKAANYERLGAKVKIHCEERVSFADDMGEIAEDSEDENFFGTADIIIIAEFKNGDVHISVDDLKFGKGVKVNAEENEQLLSYGLAVAAMFSLAYNVTRICMAIHQPRLDHTDEWEVPLERIYEFREEVKPAAALSLKLADDLNAGRTTVAKMEKQGHLVAGEDQCCFCRAKGHCPVFVKDTLKKVDDMFDNLDDVPDVKKVVRRMDKGLVTLDQIENFGLIVDQLEDFIKAVRGRIQAELYDGKKLKRFKLVQGRKGNRAWRNEEEVKALFKKFRLKGAEWYSKELISPPAAEKVFGSQLRRWNQLQKVITQSPGRPTIAPIKDKRPSIQPPNVNDMFDDLEDGNFDDLA